MHPIAIVRIVALSVFLTGCYMFVPTHPGTWLVGSIRGTDGLPLSNAQVMLYGTTQKANASGCFNVQLADALPFTLRVAAVGHKPVEMKASPGFFRVDVRLAGEQSVSISRAEWIGITESEYRSSKPCD